MKIEHTYWFSPGTGHIGVVIGEDTFTREKKAYIGVVAGFDQEADTKTVAELGARLSREVLLEMAELLKPPKKARGK
jgi:hypothetical protein